MGLEKILVLDDEPVLRRTLEEHLRRKRHTVAGAESVARAEEYLAKDDFDLVFLDVHLPDGDGTQILDRLGRKPDGPLFVVMTGNATIESAVGCMRAGAFDYIIKPFSLGQIDVLLRKAESFNQLVKVNQFFTREAAGGSEIQLVGEGLTMKLLRQLVSKVAPTEATVLVNGENGTGKELVANELFRQSNRSDKPFIRVNCAAVSETLIESEFFGHEKGAFTGAAQKREGRFELANNGTILLDEISEISPRVQAKLLRVLQEREFERVGGNKTIKVNVRVIATTNRDLQKAVERGDFRQDLYYRLNVFPIQVPPLRARKEDIPAIARHFLDRCGRRHGIRVRGFDEEAMADLMAHDWPGNVRELQNTIERAVILTEDGSPIRASALGLRGIAGDPGTFGLPVPAPVRAPTMAPPPSATPVPPAPAPHRAQAEPHSPQLSLPFDDPQPVRPPAVIGNQIVDTSLPLEEIEKRHILAVLEETGGNRTQAAAILAISSRTLRNKIAQYRQQGVPIAGDG
ncbi:MAG: sigma-54-dependent transcriptional regulator [Opitutaceae bacterium]